MLGYDRSPYRVIQRWERCQGPYVRSPAHHDLVLAPAQEFTGLYKLMTTGPALHHYNLQYATRETKGTKQLRSVAVKTCGIVIGQMWKQ